MVDTQDTRSSRGLSRRDMIKGAAVAGAAAWTAPVIIDSLSSPAGAFSGTCHKYYIKFAVRGSGAGTAWANVGKCYCAEPACPNSGFPNGSGTTSGYTHLCSGSGVCTTNNTPQGPVTFSPTTANATSYTVTLPPGCEFDTAKTNFGAVGNYDFGGSSGACSNASISGDKKSATYTTVVSGKTLDYAYAEFCCPS
jgi:hypothetical protein